MRKYFLYSFFFIFLIGFLGSLNTGGYKKRKIQKKEEAKSLVKIGDEIVPNFNEKVFSDGRRARILKFVEKAIKHLQTQEESKALSDFSHSKEFKDGELYIFVYNSKGVCLAHGQEQDLIWDDLLNSRDIFGTHFIQSILKKAKKGGGWVTYQWRNTAKVSYVKLVQKDGKSFTIGAGFYPIAKRDTIVNLVKEAVELFRTDIKKGLAASESFSELSYPLGKFVLGDLYLFAMDFDGMLVAQGDRPGLIGQNALDYVDESGKYINKDIIKKLQVVPEGTGIWEEYLSKKARKITYAEKVTDSKGQQYFIACGYYPDSNRKKVVDLVKQGYTYMNKNGVSVASGVFSDKRNLDYRYGDLSLFVYDYNGKCIAHGENPEFVGRNRYNEKDADGRYSIRMLIEKAKKGGGWIDFKGKNSYFFSYIEPIKIGVDNFVIGSGLYPISKPEALQLLVKGGAGYLRDKPKDKAFREFVDRHGKFVKGDLDLFVFDFKGICYAYGSQYDLIRKNMFEAKDEDGRPFVKLFINTAKEGSGSVVFKENGRLKTAFVMRVDKGDEQFVIGSSFFYK